MRKVIITLLFLCGIHYGANARSDNPTLPDSLLIIDLTCQIHDKQKPIIKGHRTPAQTPTVYMSTSCSSLYFEDPCYECTLEIVVPGTDNIMYAYVIPDGDNVVTLPEWLEGQYELHIHRGNFCFWGVIEL